MRDLEVGSVGELDGEVFGEDTAEKVEDEDEEEHDGERDDNEKGWSDSDDDGEDGKSGDAVDIGSIKSVVSMGVLLVGMEAGLAGRIREGLDDKIGVGVGNNTEFDTGNSKGCVDTSETKVVEENED
ncbi:hypothetical protein BGX27_002186 [Mortierella sp. AM989]|nr:hypothetical protein BGX27_002186 [Mortierella sp. AM989]